MGNSQRPVCIICQQKIRDHEYPCDSCGQPYHKECFDNNHGCANFGCDSNLGRLSLASSSSDMPPIPPVDAPTAGRGRPEPEPGPFTCFPCYFCDTELESAPPLSYAPIEELNDRHRAIAQMEIMGWKNKQIAKELNCHQMTIHRVRSSPIYKIYVSDLRKQVEEASVFDAVKYLDRITPKLLRRLEYLAENADSENVQVTANLGLLDRSMPKVTKTQHEETKIIEFGDSVQNLAAALADNLSIKPEQLTGKSDEEVIDLLEGEIDAPQKSNEEEEQEASQPDQGPEDPQ